MDLLAAGNSLHSASTIMKNGYLSKWAQNVSPSPTLAVDAKAKALKAAGRGVCGFGAGEPDFDTPSFLKDACAEALAEGKDQVRTGGGFLTFGQAWPNNTPVMEFLPNLRLLKSWLAPEENIPAILLFWPPADRGRGHCSRAPTGLVIPKWSNWPELRQKSFLPGMTKGFKVTPAQIEETLSPSTRMLILNSPSNPTGCLYERGEMEAIVDLACKHDFLIMSDEIYEYLLYDGAAHHRPASFGPEAAERVITVSGFSKTFSMTGWRLGTLVANPTIAKAVADLQSQTTSNATTFAQYGALAAIQNWDMAIGAVREMLVHFDRRRLKLLEGLESIDGVTCQRAQEAFYLFPNVSSFGLSSEEFSSRLLDDQKVAVVSGHAFGAEGYVRLSYATSDEIIEKGLDRFAEFCSKI